jgi:hypothetical protein
MHKTFSGLQGVLEILAKAVLSVVSPRGQTQIHPLSCGTRSAQHQTLIFTHGPLSTSGFEDVTRLFLNLEEKKKRVVVACVCKL